MSEINLQIVSNMDVLFAESTKQVEVIEIGWTETTYTLAISEGVSVKLYEESGQGVLQLGNETFEFILTDDMARVLTEWDNLKPSEVFASLYRNRWQPAVLSA